MPVNRRLLACLCLVALSPSVSQARDVISIRQDHDAEIITLDPGDVTPGKVFLLEDPDRLVVDVPAFSEAAAVLPASYRGALIAKLRTGRFSPGTTRIVFDLSTRVTLRDRQEKGGRLLITIAPQKSAPRESGGTALEFLFGKAEKPKPEAPKPGKDKIDPAPAAKSESPRRSEEPPRARAADEGRSARNATTARTATTGRRDAHQRQDKKPVVVIDPGHGGIDPGAGGAHGSVEKMIVLDYAQALKNRLQKSGRYQVVLTRDRDEFIMLRKRVDIARKARGDIFISLHADSAPGSARGLSVYTVSEKASDEEAAALAANENKADVLAGLNLAHEREDVAGILISLAERDTKNRSATLADLLVTALDDEVQLLPDSHRFAGFAVLKAPDIPSVLIEIGFLSHPQEEKLIKSKAHRDKVVSGIASGIESYFKKERQLRE